MCLKILNFNNCIASVYCTLFKTKNVNDNTSNTDLILLVWYIMYSVTG